MRILFLISLVFLNGCGGGKSTSSLGSFGLQEKARFQDFSQTIEGFQAVGEDNFLTYLSSRDSKRNYSYRVIRAEGASKQTLFEESKDVKIQEVLFSPLSQLSFLLVKESPFNESHLFLSSYTQSGLSETKLKHKKLAEPTFEEDGRFFKTQVVTEEILSYWTIPRFPPQSVMSEDGKSFASLIQSGQGLRLVRYDISGKVFQSSLILPKVKKRGEGVGFYTDIRFNQELAQGSNGNFYGLITLWNYEFKPLLSLHGIEMKPLTSDGVPVLVEMNEMGKVLSATEIHVGKALTFVSSILATQGKVFVVGSYADLTQNFNQTQLYLAHSELQKLDFKYEKLPIDSPFVRGKDIIVTPKGNYLISGYLGFEQVPTNSWVKPGDGFLLSLNKNLQPLAFLRYGGARNDMFHHLRKFKDKVYLSASVDGPLTHDPENVTHNNAVIFEVIE